MITKFLTKLFMITTIAIFIISCGDSNPTTTEDNYSSSSLESSSSLTFSSSSTTSDSSETSSSSIASSSSEDIFIDYPAKSYALERDPNINVWGAGIYLASTDSDPDLDYKYLLETNETFEYDLMFYTVTAYSTDAAGETTSAGVPAFLLADGIRGAKVGEGMAFFDSLQYVDSGIISELKEDYSLDYDNYLLAPGEYDKEGLSLGLDSCLIGERFRSNILVVPEGSTEQEVQAVYVIETIDNHYAKFMVTYFKGEGADKKKTIVQWQLLNE